MTPNAEAICPVSIESIPNFPFDIISMTGNDSVEFMHRISTQTFSHFVPGAIQKTLLITEKGRMIDTIWVIHRSDHLLLLVSGGMADEICEWLEKYIIMEDIVLHNISDQCAVSIHFSDDIGAVGYSTDYFSIPVVLSIHPSFPKSVPEVPVEFEYWRIWNGIPVTKKEIVREYNPLELRLKDWISFSKGCYIGQEVIARLDTYNKVQRALYRCTSDVCLSENDILLNQNGDTIGNITSVTERQNRWIALAMLKTKSAAEIISAVAKQSNIPVICEPCLNIKVHGRN
jgi:folate-binding protein YgfZ